MEKGILLQVVADYGLILGLLIVIVYVLWLIAKQELHGIFSFHPRATTEATLNNNSKLTYHSFFANSQYKINVEIPNLDLSPNKPVKQQMFRDILTIYTKTLYAAAKDIAAMDLMTEWAPDKWCDEVTRKFNQNLSTFRGNCKDNGVPDVVMVKFSKWNATCQEILFDTIMSLCNSNMFKTNIARTNTLFFTLNLLLVITIKDAENTLKSLNGDVHGKIYNGKVIEA